MSDVHTGDPRDDRTEDRTPHPCSARTPVAQAPGQDYVGLTSKEFWTRVGNGKAGLDHSVGEACALMCSKFRAEALDTLVPQLIGALTNAPTPGGLT